MIQNGWHSSSFCLSQRKSLYLLLTTYSFSENSILATFDVILKVIKVSRVSKCFCGLSILMHKSVFSSTLSSDKFSISWMVEKLSILADCIYEISIISMQNDKNIDCYKPGRSSHCVTHLFLYHL